MSTGNADSGSVLAHCLSPPVTIEQKFPIKLIQIQKGRISYTVNIILKMPGYY